eukprot:COSAG01_NODE_50859_length_359_cov_3.734615_1_plen_42_part_10
MRSGPLNDDGRSRYEKFQEDLVLDISTVLDAMRSETTRQNRQ